MIRENESQLSPLVQRGDNVGIMKDNQINMYYTEYYIILKG